MIFLPFLTLALTNLAPVDALFLRTAAMAVSRTKNPRVRRACEIMIRDHTRELAQVRGLASRFGMDLPSEPTEAHKALFTPMSKMEGHEFDRSFSRAQLQDHMNEVEVGVDPQVRTFAKGAVTLLARHKAIWRKVAPSVGVERTFGRPYAEEILTGEKP